MPYISVIIPTYNRATAISRTIDSFIAQDYQNWEMIVVDDHSTDNTREVIAEYELKDSRIHYLINERKKGAQGARNTGIIHSQADWVICFDSDNSAHPDMLRALIDGIRPNIDVVSCFSNVLDANTQNHIGTFEWVSEGDIHQNLYSWISYVDFNQAIIRKSKLFDTGLLDEDCPSMQEWETHIRLSKIAKYTTIHRHLLDYYVNGSDAISTDKKREVRGHLYVFNKHKEEWKENKDALDWMIGRTYSMIKLSKNVNFQIYALWCLSKISAHTIPFVLKKWIKSVKRRIKR